MKRRLLIFLIIPAFLITSCGGDGDSEQTAKTQTVAQEEGLSEFELEHGIGPVTERIEIGELNKELASKGGDIFAMKCEACHSLDQRVVGPELGEVLDRRSPEFVMNMILNPGGMTKEHPVGKELLQEYMSIMPFQNVEKEDARAIVEYLREQQK